MTYRGKKQDALIQVRCYSEEKRAAEELAKRSGKSLSDMIREMLAAAVRRTRKA